MLAPGDTFDRYLIDAVLGEGGMGRVYLARDTRLGRKVALKLLHSDAASAEGAARLVREARAAAAFEHPNAVGVYDVGEVDGLPYLAMEYVEGRSLRSAIGDASVPMATRVRWLVDVARALGAAHARALVHRDVKPENVMIRADGVVKVVDFGIARHAKLPDVSTASTADGGIATLTEAGSIIGTPRYMAPEQMLGQSVDGRADQFTWGVVAFELLTGRVPWSATDGVKLVAEIVSETALPRLAARSEGVPEEVARVVDRALSKKPSARFPSMEAIVAALEALSSNPTLVTHATTSTTRATPRGWIVAVPLVAAVAIAAVVFGRAGNRSTSGASSGASAASALAQSAAPVPTKMTDVPMPASSNAEALLVYRKARQDWHDASLWRGVAGMEKAARLDPALGAPLVAQLAWDNVADAAATFSAARQLRATMSERDQSLLDAVAPVASDEPDFAAASSRFVDLAARHPGDAEMQLLAGVSLGWIGRYSEAFAAFDRALALDPTFASAHWARAQIERSSDDVMRALDKCVAASPTAASCVRNMALAKQRVGDCAAMDALSRKLTTVEPGFEWSQAYVLNALVARGATREETAPLLATLHAIALAESRPNMDSFWPAIVAFHFGAFDEGIALLEHDSHAQRRRALTLAAALESGDVRRAREEARQYVAARSVATWSDVQEDGPALHRALLSGAISSESAARLAATWGKQDTSRVAGLLESRGLEFVMRAAAATTPAEARSASRGVDVAATVMPEWGFGPGATLVWIAGRALLRAGDVENALPLLREASIPCGLIEPHHDGFLFSRVAARLELADALAQKGDVAGACEWLGKIVAQWGNAKPRSVTAETAKKRMTKLRCAR